MGKRHLRRPGQTFIRCMVCAAEVALALREQSGDAHAAAIVTRTGRVLDLTPFTGPNASIEDALRWAECMVVSEPNARGIVLLSTWRGVMEDLRDGDIPTIEEARGRLREYGVALDLWVRCDAERMELVTKDEVAERGLQSSPDQDGSGS